MEALPPPPRTRRLGVVAPRLLAAGQVDPRHCWRRLGRQGLHPHPWHWSRRWGVTDWGSWMQAGTMQTPLPPVCLPQAVQACRHTFRVRQPWCRLRAGPRGMGVSSVCVCSVYVGCRVCMCVYVRVCACMCVCVRVRVALCGAGVALCGAAMCTLLTNHPCFLPHPTPPHPILLLLLLHQSDATPLGTGAWLGQGPVPAPGLASPPLPPQPCLGAVAAPAAPAASLLGQLRDPL